MIFGMRTMSHKVYNVFLVFFWGGGGGEPNLWFRQHCARIDNILSRD